MREDTSISEVMPDARKWVQILAHYRRPSYRRGLFEIAITALPLILIWALMLLALKISYWVCLLLALPAAGLLVRLFMIQHDCGHTSFFRHRFANDWVGRIIGVLTLTPYEFWRRTHACHHATSGNLDRRGIGDVDVLTVREFLALPWRRRFLYRLYRHPFVLFVIGPPYLFILRYRLPIGLMPGGWSFWLSTIGTNAAIAALIALMICVVGFVPFVLVQLPITLLAGFFGVWLFYVQHQFEETSWDGEQNWSFHDASLYGSSHYELPLVLRWFTANIGVHHVHHLCSRIPFYRLQQVLRDYPQLAAVSRLTLFQSFKSIRMVLWDEDKRRLVAFRGIRHAGLLEENGIALPEIGPASAAVHANELTITAPQNP
jgi:omega-6 fatty acid desaturase (delta-12 desaturase)